MGPNKEVFENRFTAIIFYRLIKKFALTQPLKPVTAHHKFFVMFSKQLYVPTEINKWNSKPAFVTMAGLSWIILNWRFQSEVTDSLYSLDHRFACSWSIFSVFIITIVFCTYMASWILCAKGLGSSGAKKIRLGYLLYFSPLGKALTAEPLD